MRSEAMGGGVSRRPSLIPSRHSSVLHVLFRQRDLAVACIAMLVVALGLVFRNPQAAWIRAAMALPKNSGCRLVRNCRTMNKHIGKVPVVMPHQEGNMTRLRGVKVFGTRFRAIGNTLCSRIGVVHDL